MRIYLQFSVNFRNICAVNYIKTQEKENMSENSKKIEIKINRYIKQIGKSDVILDNGCCIQVITQNGVRVGYHYAPLEMGKKQFAELKKNEFVFFDEKMTEKANEKYTKPFLFYYRFDIEKMFEGGKYTEVKEEK